ncbi:hypothetical protein [Nitrospirillum iridis]|uniref:Uncharacterized protein n=1 Tax=Nitrospirillum iridis TaxID=765888 RepID=A0A7X0ATB1_9PROT|nr:hypothetical protein [Nitrospirillum iridis]MBB6249680.1 hypothetical protein [Nitrospirillum iridis]
MKKILAGLRTVVLIEERVRRLDSTVGDLRRETTRALADHERRLTRLETIVEIARPHGATLRISRQPEGDNGPGGG